jgi:hypothetical protein
VNSSQKNYNNYLQGKSRLENAVLQHPSGENKIMDLLKKETNRTFWVKPFADWKKQTTKK